MQLAVFWGCKILTSQYAYEMSVRQVMPKLGVELVDLKEVNCCGNPIESVNRFATIYMSARILALTNEIGLRELLLPCSRCHFTTCETQYLLATDKKLEEKITSMLREENLNYTPDIKIWHTVDLLHDNIGLERIRKSVKREMGGLKFASHIGCQAIRPSYMKRVDNAENPRKLDRLIEALGAESIEYPEKLDCCGAALLFSHQEASLSLTGAKLRALQERRVDGLVTSCPSCHIMFDTKQENSAALIGSKLSIPVIYYTQLLGLAMQIKEEDLGLHLNKSPVDAIIEKIEKRSGKTLQF